MGHATNLAGSSAGCIRMRKRRRRLAVIVEIFVHVGGGGLSTRGTNYPSGPVTTPLSFCRFAGHVLRNAGRCAIDNRTGMRRVSLIDR